MTDVYAGLLARARGDGHVANGAAKILLDLARTTVDVDPTDPDTKPLEDMTSEERIALYARVYAALTEEDAGDEVESRDGHQAHDAEATVGFRRS